MVRTKNEVGWVTRQEGLEDGGSSRDETTLEEGSEVACGALHQLSCRQTPDL